MKGLVSNIQRYSVNDGYGIRTIVFLVGCGMRCAWCQNPETIGGRKALMFIEESCEACGACLAECAAGAILPPDGAVGLDRRKCSACLKCVDVCYFGARKASFKEMDFGEVFREVMKDEAFFRSSGGGLTLSGGEPLLQADFCRELLRQVGEAGLHTAVETSGHVPYDAIEAALPHTDLFLYDVKMVDEKKHVEYTGVTNRRILGNLVRLVRTGVEIFARVPLIPGVNDGREFEAIADMVAAVGGIRELHILPYHTLGMSKYPQLGMVCAVGDLPEENDAEVERCRAYAEGKGLRVSVGGHGFSKNAGGGVAVCAR